jgi:hypothetical protein
MGARRIIAGNGVKTQKRANGILRMTEEQLDLVQLLENEYRGSAGDTVL